MSRWLISYRHVLAASLIFSLLLLSGCAGPRIDQYADQKPPLDLAAYFSGTTTGWGMVTDRSGAITRRFVVRIEGSFSAGKGTLRQTAAKCSHAS
ncbi:MAG: DUF3833 family protein, partial [Burkholderiaceae bacterium]